MNHVKRSVLIIIALFATLTLWSVMTQPVHGAAGYVRDDTTGEEYAKLYNAFQAIPTGETRTLTVYGTVQAGYYSGTYAYMPQNCNITIMAGDDEATITGSISQSNTNLTLGNGGDKILRFISGGVTVYSGTFTSYKDVSMESSGNPLMLGTTSNGVVEASVNGGTFKSSNDAAIVSLSKNAVVHNITDATIEGVYGSYEGALTICYGAKVEKIVNPYITAHGKFGIDVSRGGQVDSITGGDVTNKGFNNYGYLGGTGISVRFGVADQKTKIGKIKGVTIHTDAVGRPSSSSDGALGSGIYLDYSQGGICSIDSIEGCTISTNANYNYMAGIQALSLAGREDVVIGEIKGCTITCPNGASGIFMQSAHAGTLENNTVKVNTELATGTGNGIALWNDASIEQITGGEYNAPGTTSRSGLHLRKTTGDVSPTVGSIKGVTFVGSRQGIYNESGTIKSISDETSITAQGMFGIWNQGTIETIEDSEIKSTYVNPQGGSTQSFGIYNNGGTITSISGCTVAGSPEAATSYGIFTNASGTIETIENCQVTALNRAIHVQSGTYGTLKDNQATGDREQGLYMGQNGKVTTVDGGIYVGGKDAICIKTGQLGKLTGAAVLYGKDGYAINNLEAGEPADIEPTLSTEPKGYARYYGTEGVAANNHIADPDYDEYPTNQDNGQKYFMSQGTTSVKGFDGIPFHYLTVVCRLTYDANNGKGERKLGYEGEWKDDLTAEESGFSNPGYTFKGWNTKADGSGKAYEPGALLDIDRADFILYAQWEKIPDPSIVYTITYKLNGGEYEGSTEDIKETYEAGTVIRIHKKPMRAGYTFLYWEGSKYDPGQDYTVNSDHTFTAQWKKKDFVDPNDPDDSSDPEKPEQKKNVKKQENAEKDAQAPETGDEDHFGLIMLFLLAATLFGILLCRRRDQKGAVK